MPEAMLLTTDEHVPSLEGIRTQWQQRDLDRLQVGGCVGAEKRPCHLRRNLNVKENTSQRRSTVRPRPSGSWQPPPSCASPAQHSPATPLGTKGPEACAHLGLNYSTQLGKGQLLTPFSFQSSPAGSSQLFSCWLWGGSAGITDWDKETKASYMSLP